MFPIITIQIIIFLKKITFLGTSQALRSFMINFSVSLVNLHLLILFSSKKFGHSNENKILWEKNKYYYVRFIQQLQN